MQNHVTMNNENLSERKTSGILGIVFIFYTFNDFESHCGKVKNNKQFEEYKSEWKSQYMKKYRCEVAFSPSIFNFRKKGESNEFTEF